MDNKILLGKRIRELRLKKGLSQEGLAEAVGIEPTSLSNIENGRNYPLFSTLEKIINVLGVEFGEMFILKQHQEPQNLLDEIVSILKENPNKIQDTYKIVKALCK